MRKFISIFFRFLDSRLFFWLILLINILFVCFTRLSPSLDGPAHLYNASLLKEIITGNSYLKAFYAVNSIYQPNWTGHIVLMFLRFLLPGWLAEKVLIIGYISGMALSFRFLVLQFNRNNSLLSLLIFPFIYSFLFRLGFYNFCISFIFFFLSFGYYLKTLAKERLSNYMILSLLFTIAYFSNLLIYCFLGFTAGLLALSTLKMPKKGHAGMKSSIMAVLRRLLYLMAATLPSLVLMFMFLRNAPLSSSQEAYSSKELLSWLFNARPFIIFNTGRESVYTRKLFYLMIAFLAVLLFQKWKRHDWSLRFRQADLLLVPALISLVLLFTMPNASGAGMMSDRFALMFFIFLVTWLANRIEYSRLNHILILLLLVLHLSMLNQYHKRINIRLAHDAESIYNVTDFIEGNTILLPVNLTGNWFQGHHSNYPGADRSVVILENYEAVVGWFPLKWNYSGMPNIKLGDLQQVSGVTWITNLNSEMERQVDYILVYGDLSKLDDEKWSELRFFLQDHCEMIHESEDGFVRLYSRL